MHDTLEKAEEKELQVALKVVVEMEAAAAVFFELISEASDRKLTFD